MYLDTVRGPMQKQYNVCFYTCLHLYIYVNYIKIHVRFCSNYNIISNIVSQSIAFMRRYIQVRQDVIKIWIVINLKSLDVLRNLPFFFYIKYVKKYAEKGMRLIHSLALSKSLFYSFWFDYVYLRLEIAHVYVIIRIFELRIIKTFILTYTTKFVKVRLINSLKRNSATNKIYKTLKQCFIFI